MLSLLVICVFVTLFVGGGIWAWRMAKEPQGLVSEWLEDLLRPVLAPAVKLSLPRLQQRAVAVVLGGVEVTSSGRGILRSPVILYFSTSDFARVEPLGDLIKPEIVDEVVAKANKLDWDVPKGLVLELACDRSLVNGRPQVEIGRPVRKFSPIYGETDLLLAPTEAGADEDGLTRPAKTVAYPVADTPLVVEELVSLGDLPTITLDPGRSVTTIGRKDADVIIDHEEVSRRHAELCRGAGGSLEIFDVGSRTGTFVNSERVKRTSLVNGDEVRFSLGGPRFVFSRLAAGEEA